MTIGYIHTTVDSDYDEKRQVEFIESVELITGYIYRIVHNDSDLCYVGSTIKPIGKRWTVHKSHYRRWKAGKRTGLSIFPYFEKFGIENFRMVLIKSYEVLDEKDPDKPNQSNRHLCTKEALWMYRYRTSCCNEISPFGNPRIRNLKNLKKREEYHSDPNNRVVAAAHMRISRANEEQSLYHRTKTEIVCPCGTTVSHKDILKKHHQSAFHKSWKAGEQPERSAATVQCECGKWIVNENRLPEHRRTKKHLLWQAGQPTEEEEDLTE